MNLLDIVQVMSLSSGVPEAKIGDIATVVALHHRSEKLVAVELESVGSRGETLWQGAYEIQSVRLLSQEEAKGYGKTNKRAKHKNRLLCPVCTRKLEKIGSGTRRKNQCTVCKAVLAKELTCERCNKNRVWRGSDGIVCHGCGHSHK